MLIIWLISSDRIMTNLTMVQKIFRHVKMGSVRHIVSVATRQELESVPLATKTKYTLMFNTKHRQRYSRI